MRRGTDDALILGGLDAAEAVAASDLRRDGAPWGAVPARRSA